MFIAAQVFLADAQIQEKLLPFFKPEIKPFLVFPRFTEKFQLRNFKLARTENKVARGNLIAKRFSDLRNAKRHFLAHAFLHELKIHKHSLRGFGPQESYVRRILHRTQERFEH